MTHVHLHIDRLVLDGWPPGALDAAAVRAALEAELARLLAAGDPGFGTGGARGRVDSGAAAWSGDPAALGAAVGQAVYRRLGP